MEPRIQDDYNMALETGHLESKYEKTLLLSAHLLDAERNRIKCMEHLFLEFDNYDLRSQLNHVSDQLAKTIKSENDVRAQLHDTYKEVARVQGIVQASARTSDSLHKEIELLINVVIKSEKLPAEKNLSGIQSEFKQNRMKDTPLSIERDSLQRQFDTLKEQLENEKRESQRARAKEIRQAEEVADLSTRLEGTRKQLQEEIQTRAYQEHDSQRQSHEWETQRNSLKRELESLHKTLRSTKDELQGVGKNMKHHDNVMISGNNDPDPQSYAIPFRRSPTRVNTDMAIATPGAVQTRDETKKATALPGDKSAFSITPFLSRASALQDSSSSSDDDSDKLRTMNKTEMPFLKSRSSGTQRRPIETRPAKPIVSAKGLLRNPNKQTLNPHGFNSNEVSTSINSGMPLGHSDNRGQFDGHGVSRNQSTDLAVSRIKKRKLGSPRDHEPVEDLDGFKRPGRKLAGHNATRDDFQQPNLARLPRSRVFGGSTGFSPLKRDRK